MTGANALGAFLRAHRGAVQPASAGLPEGRTARRTPGLRREEVAELAGVSIDYYARLERGVDAAPSAAVLEALARALQLTADETAHLHRLAGLTVRAPRTSGQEAVSSQLAALLEQWHDQPALVLGRYRDVLAVNELGAAINPHYRLGANLVEQAFLDPAARQLYPDWEEIAEGAVAGLRAGSRPDDRRLHSLVGRLSVASPDFARIWARQHVLERATGRKRFALAAVGVLELDYQVFQVVGADRQTLYVFPLNREQRDTVELLMIPAVAAHDDRDASGAPVSVDDQED